MNRNQGLLLDGGAPTPPTEAVDQVYDFTEDFTLASACGPGCRTRKLAVPHTLERKNISVNLDEGSSPAAQCPAQANSRNAGRLAPVPKLQVESNRRSNVDRD